MRSEVKRDRELMRDTQKEIQTHFEYQQLQYAFAPVHTAHIHANTYICTHTHTNWHIQDTDTYTA